MKAKNNNKYRSGKPNTSKNRANTEVRTNDKREKVGYKSSAHNDVTWYTANGQLLKDTASFNFNRPAGEPINLYTDPNGTGTIDPKVPGIMAIYTAPTVGVSRSSIDPVNKAMQKIYSFVRHANSGHSNYDPADLMLYLLAMDSVYTYWAYLTRIYGCATVVSKDNLYVGDSVLRAMGVDPISIRTNLSQFRALINQYALRASTWAVPNVMPYYLRHTWMYSNIYKDEDTSRAQYYMYVPAGLYKFDIDSTTGAGYLKYIEVAATAPGGIIAPRTTNRLTITALQTIADDILGAIEGVEDVGIMSGDIIKAYGADKLWQLVSIPEDYAVVPVYSAEVLAQIHNTEFVGTRPLAYSESGAYSYSTSALNVYQDTTVGGGFLKFWPHFQGAWSATCSKLLDFWYNDVTPEMAMVASRNFVAGQFSGSYDGSTVAVIDSCGSELAFCATISTINGDGTETVDTVSFIPGTITTDNILKMMRFNEAPTFIIWNGNGTASGYFGELDNFAVLSQDNVKNLHMTALLSMFNVANVG